MGPIDYSDMVISTRLSDGKVKADNVDGNETIVIGLIMGVVSFPCAFLMGLYVWHNIGPIVAIVVIGLGFWASARYGTNDSLVARFRYRTKRVRPITESQKIKMRKRLIGLD